MKENKLGQLIASLNNKEVYLKDGLITKVFDPKHYSGSDVLKEAMNEDYALELGFNVPKVFAVFQIEDSWVLQTVEIKGKTLKQLIEENPKDAKKYIDLLVKIQLEILSKTSDNLKLPKLKDKLNRYISNNTLLDKVTKFELQTKLEQMPNHYKVCHGDLDLHNIIIDEEGKCFILDWAHVSRGNASADAASTFIALLLSDRSGLADIYLKEFSNKAKIDISYIQQWIAVVSASKIASITDKSKVELLMKFIDVIESY